MRRIFSLVLSVTLLAGCFCANVSAQESTSVEAVHTYTAAEDFASDEWRAAARGAYLGNGTSSITREDSTHINISGSTNATKKCDKVVLTLYVERSKSYATGYSTYKTYHYTAEDVYQIVKGISNISVEKGYYYRVKGVHSVTHLGTTETTDSVTDPIDYR